MKLAEWLKDRDRGLDERLILVARLLDALRGFHENEPGSRPALDPGSVDVDDDGCRLEPAPRALDPRTASYRAPETNEGAPYAPAADTFSAGVLCYQILAGRHPFLVETSQGTLEPLTNLPATPLRDVSPEVPRDLADALMACLDDYVGVSNTNMHLRAGVRPQAHVLVPLPPEWRWMAQGEESPWYRNFSIFRQKYRNDWKEPLEQLINSFENRDFS